MQRNWLNVPHVTQFDEADITDLEAFRASPQVRGRASVAQSMTPDAIPGQGLRGGFARTIRNSTVRWRRVANSWCYKKYVHIGMAVDTPAGLVVPVIRDVDRKTIWELSEEVLSLAGKARDRKLTPTEMQGGCFTISSLGNIGGTGFHSQSSTRRKWAYSAYPTWR